MISVVIPVRNRTTDLRDCIASIEASAQNTRSAVEILVVDDRSDEDIVAATSNFEMVKVIKNGGIGPGAARNTGMDNAKGQFVCFIDSDCVADENWLNRMENIFAREGILAVQGNPCLFMHKQNQRLGKCEELLYSGLFASYVYENQCSQIDSRNCAFRKDVPEILGEDLFITKMEQAQAEARVCGLNLVHRGIKIEYSGDAKVFHRDPENLAASMRQKKRHGSGRIHVWNNIPSIRHLFKRYYWNPIVHFEVPWWYVLPTHSAFLWGYFSALVSKNIRSLSPVLPRRKNIRSTE